MRTFPINLILFFFISFCAFNQSTNAQETIEICDGDSIELPLPSMGVPLSNGCPMPSAGTITVTNEAGEVVDLLVTPNTTTTYTITRTHPTNIIQSPGPIICGTGLGTYPGGQYPPIGPQPPIGPAQPSTICDYTSPSIEVTVVVNDCETPTNSTIDITVVPLVEPILPDYTMTALPISVFNFTLPPFPNSTSEPSNTNTTPCLSTQGGNISNNSCNNDDYPWLSDLVDENDCANNSLVAEYSSGASHYIYIANDSETGGTLYNEDGVKYCESTENFDCLSFYGLSGLTPNVLWTCSGKSNGSIAEELNVNVYPNPSQGVFTLDLNTVSDAAFLSIHDLSGQQILSQSASISNHLDLRNYPKGIYIMRIIDGAQNINKKLIID